MTRTTRWLPILMWLVILAAPSPVGAQESIFEPPKGPTFDKGAGPIALYAETGAGGASGAYSHVIQIPIPPAWHGLRPKVSLRYSSLQRKTFSPVGAGWVLTAGARVFRGGSKGVPRYTELTGGTDDDPLRYELEGEGGDLVFVAAVGNELLYRPAGERQTFAKFYYTPLPGESGSWRVLTPNGVTRTLGGTPSDQGPYVDENAVFCQTYAWYEAKAEDGYGNRVDYFYSVHAGQLYLESISWNNRSPSASSISFGYQANGSVNHTYVSYRKGWRAELNGRLLSTITVQAHDELGGSKTDMYSLQHDAEAMLSRFVPSGRPATRFTYAAPSTANSTRPFPAPQAVTPGNPLLETAIAPYFDAMEPYCAGNSWCPEANRLKLMIDMDGDGDLDILFVRSERHDPAVSGNQWYWRENTGSGWHPTAWPIAVPADCQVGMFWGCHSDTLEYSPADVGMGAYLIIKQATTQRVIDMTADGLPDLVYLEAVAGDPGGNRYNVRVCPGDISSGTFGFGACSTYYTTAVVEHPTTMEQLNAVPFLSATIAIRIAKALVQGPAYRDMSTYQDTRALQDMNGDGVPDLVMAEREHAV